jgi:2Fe-2S ferredoxin
MANVTWNLPGGGAITAAVPTGGNLMQAAVDNDVAGILGDCGGCLSCATCHVYVAPNWAAAFAAPDDMEQAMLDAVEAPRTEASRLSCQLTVTDAVDGLVLTVPAVE